MTGTGSSDRRIVTAGFHMSLDGYIARPGGELDWIHLSPDVIEYAIETMNSIDTMLMGGRTYHEQAAHWPKQTGALADAINAHEKVVITTHADQFDLTIWPRSRARQDPAKEIDAIRTSRGKHIGVSGGAHLFRTMMRDRLIDEIRVIVHPVTLGAGHAPWPDGLRLRLTATREFRSGAVLQTYIPVDRPELAESSQD